MFVLKTLMQNSCKSNNIPNALLTVHREECQITLDCFDMLYMLSRDTKIWGFQPNVILSTINSVSYVTARLYVYMCVYSALKWITHPKKSHILKKKNISHQRWCGNSSGVVGALRPFDFNWQLTSGEGHETSGHFVETKVITLVHKQVDV